MKTSTSILILPGIGNSDEFHWQTLWESLFPFASRIKQKNWNKPLCADWVLEIEKAVSKTHADKVYLVAHSLGCLAVVNWALKTRLNIAGALLVAPPDSEIVAQKTAASGFSPLPELKLPFKSILVASTNDPYAPSEVSKKYAETWRSWYINIGDKGHINTTSNIGFWPEGLKILHSLTNQKQILSFA